jgi:hypothetical protein
MIFYDVFDCLKEISHCGLKYLFLEILIGCCHPIDLVDVFVEFSKFGSGKKKRKEKKKKKKKIKKKICQWKKRDVSSSLACEPAKVTKRKPHLMSSEEFFFL